MRKLGWVDVPPFKFRPMVLISPTSFFADDVLLFTKAKPSQAQVINKISEDFCSISGLKVSLEKS